MPRPDLGAIAIVPVKPSGRREPEMDLIGHRKSIYGVYTRRQCAYTGVRLTPALPAECPHGIYSCSPELEALRLAHADVRHRARAKPTLACAS